MKQKWNEQEIKKLFGSVEETKKTGKPIVKAFSDFATHSGRKAHSIRNFYYAFASRLNTETNLAKNLQINPAEHLVNKPTPFTQESTDQLKAEIDKLVLNGSSVRQACLQLANGNLQDMVRFQNKYRILNAQSKPEENKVIHFPSRNPEKLSDDDVKSLFMGLVRLVKQSAYQEATRTLKAEVEFHSDTVRKTLIEISQKNQKISELQKQNKVLFSKNLMLEQKLMELRVTQLKKQNGI